MEDSDFFSYVQNEVVPVFKDNFLKKYYFIR